MQLIALDTTNQNHIDVTYDILQKRYESDHINIIDGAVPTLQQHIAMLTSGRYKYFYLIEHDDSIVGYIYIANPNNEYGYFLNIKEAQRVYKNNRHNILDEDVLEIDGHKIKKMWHFYGRAGLKLLLEKHPDIKQITAKVNPANKKSRQGIEYVLNFKPVYVYYELNIP